MLAGVVFKDGARITDDDIDTNNSIDEKVAV